MIRAVKPSDDSSFPMSPRSSTGPLSRRSGRLPTTKQLAAEPLVLLRVSPFTHSFAEALPESPDRKLQNQSDLKRAGRLHPHAYQKLAATRCVGLLLSMIVFGTLINVAPRAVEPWFVFALSIGMIGSWWLPVFVLRRLAARRIGEIEQSLPDLFSLMSLCLSQGESVPRALATVARDLRPVHRALADELTIVCRQAELGTLERALENFEQRVDLVEIRRFNSLLLQADELGSDVSAEMCKSSESLSPQALAAVTGMGVALVLPTVLWLVATWLLLFGPGLIERPIVLQRGVPIQTAGPTEIANALRE